MAEHVRLLDYAPAAPAEQEEDTGEHQVVLPVLLARVRNLQKHPAGKAETDMESCPMVGRETQNPAGHTATVAAVAHPMGRAEMEP